MSEKNQKKETTMIHIYHHNDADGRLSAAIVIDYIDYHAAAVPFKLHECSYGPVPSFDDLGPNDTVWIVDYSFKDADFARLVEQVGEAHIIWIDHHASCKDSSYLSLMGERSFVNKGPAACQLVWEYLYSKDPPEPFVVSLVGDYDSWAMRREPACRQFYEACKADERLMAPAGWVPLLSDEKYVGDMILRGHSILRSRDGYLAGLRKSFGYMALLADPRWSPLDFDERGQHLAVPALNVQQFGSAAFTVEQMASSLFCIAYCHDGREFRVSLYSENPDVDCGQIAKAFGGGGHRGAAGFKCEALPWGKA